MGRLLLLLVPLLAAGMALGFAAGAGTAEVTVTTAPPVPAGAPASARHEPDRALPAPPPIPARPTPRRTPGEPAQSIHGCVRTPLGDAVPGVAISAAPVDRPGEPTASCRTGSDGCFEVPTLDAGPYRITAKGEGFRIEPVGKEVVRPGGRADFTASPAEALRVRVLLPDGTEPAEAEVSWALFAGAPEAGEADWSPGDPVVELPPGPWTLRASAGEDGEYASEPVAFAPPAPGAPREISLPLRSRPGLLCRLRPADEAFDGTIELRVAPVNGMAGREPEAVLRESDPVRQLGSGEPAAVFLSDLEPGSYCIGACAANGLVLGHAFAEAGPEFRTVEIVLGAPDRGRYLVVRAVDPRGGPVSEFAGRIRSADSGEGGCMCGSCLRRNMEDLPDGSWRLWFPETGDSGGFWLLEARAEGCALQRFPFVRDAAPELRVKFDEPAWLDIAFEDPGEEEDGVRVRLVPADGPEVSTWLECGGTNRLGPVRPGTFSIRTTVSAGDLPCSPSEITLVQGLNRTTLRVGLGYEAVVAFGAEGAGVYATVTSEEGRTVWRDRADDDGDLRVRRLLPGTYRVARQDRGQGSMTFVVPGPSRILFAPDPVDCLRVTVNDGNRLLARWGLRDGDLVVAVDGQEIPSAGAARALLELAATRESCTLTVLRAGESFDLDVPAPRFEPRALGGSLTPAAR